MNDERYKYTKYYKDKQETRWADIDEIKSESAHINILDNSYAGAGLPLLSDGTDVWLDNSDSHSLIFGSTGSKKSRLFCMPLLHMMAGAGESFVVTDPKGELYNKTSGFVKEKGYDVFVLNYRNLSLGDTWNPLALPYELYHSGYKDDAIARINDFVNAISENQMNNTKDIFWVNAARSVAIAILFLMLDECTKEECNLKTFTQFCVEFGKGTNDPYYESLGLSENEKNKNYLTQIMELASSDSIASLNYYGIAGSSDKARGDVQSTLFTIIQVFMNQENIVRNMSYSSFDIRALGQKKTAVYIIVPDEKNTYHFIASIFVKQCYETLVQEAQKSPDNALPIRVNFVLDEFANIPTLPDMPSMITAARSRNMRFFLVIQSLHQLVRKYGDEAHTIKGNCDNWVFLASKEINLLEEISKLCGNVKHDYEMETEKTPLISVSQLQRLNKQRGEALIFYSRQYPLITELADIDEYSFPKLEPFKMNDISNIELISISPKSLYNEIVSAKRYLPFTKSMFKSKEEIVPYDGISYIDDDDDDFDDDDFDDDDDFFKIDDDLDEDCDDTDEYKEEEVFGFDKWL